jgi:ABC-type sugar transport system ATPase subunit
MQELEQRPGGVTGPAPAVLAQGVTKRFGGVVALDNVTFSARAGQVTALVGDNGAGKSTLIRCLSGVHSPDEGGLFMNGAPVTFSGPNDARLAGIETVHQNLALADNLDVAANLFLGRELSGGPRSLFRLRKKPMEAKAAELIDEYGIRMPNIKAKVGAMSGGQRQGIAIARAVGWGSEVVLMDEPTAALGVKETGRVLEVVRSLADRGLAVVLISHNIEQVMQVSDFVWVLRGGHMIADLRAENTNTQEVVHYITTGVGLGA